MAFCLSCFRVKEVKLADESAVGPEAGPAVGSDIAGKEILMRFGLFECDQQQRVWAEESDRIRNGRGDNAAAAATAAAAGGGSHRNSPVPTAAAAASPAADGSASKEARGARSAIQHGRVHAWPVQAAAAADDTALEAFRDEQGDADDDRDDEDGQDEDSVKPGLRALSVYKATTMYDHRSPISTFIRSGKVLPGLPLPPPLAAAGAAAGAGTGGRRGGSVRNGDMYGTGRGSSASGSFRSGGSVRKGAAFYSNSDGGGTDGGNSVHGGRAYGTSGGAVGGDGEYCPGGDLRDGGPRRVFSTRLMIAASATPASGTTSVLFDTTGNDGNIDSGGSGVGVVILGGDEDCAPGGGSGRGRTANRDVAAGGSGNSIESGMLCGDCGDGGGSAPQRLATPPQPAAAAAAAAAANSPVRRLNGSFLRRARGHSQSMATLVVHTSGGGGGFSGDGGGGGSGGSGGGSPRHLRGGQSPQASRPASRLSGRQWQSFTAARGGGASSPLALQQMHQPPGSGQPGKHRLGWREEQQPSPRPPPLQLQQQQQQLLPGGANEEPLVRGRDVDGAPSRSPQCESAGGDDDDGLTRSARAVSFRELPSYKTRDALTTTGTGAAAAAVGAMPSRLRLDVDAFWRGQCAAVAAVTTSSAVEWDPNDRIRRGLRLSCDSVFTDGGNGSSGDTQAWASRSMRVGTQGLQHYLDGGRGGGGVFARGRARLRGLPRSSGGGGGGGGDQGVPSDLGAGERTATQRWLESRQMPPQRSILKRGKSSVASAVDSASEAVEAEAAEPPPGNTGRSGSGGGSRSSGSGSDKSEGVSGSSGGGRSSSGGSVPPAEGLTCSSAAAACNCYGGDDDDDDGGGDDNEEQISDSDFVSAAAYVGCDDDNSNKRGWEQIHRNDSSLLTVQSLELGSPTPAAASTPPQARSPGATSLASSPSFQKPLGVARLEARGHGPTKLHLKSISAKCHRDMSSLMKPDLEREDAPCCVSAFNC